MPPKRLLGAALLAVACCLLPCAPAQAVTPNGRLQLIHLDVGQGDGTLLITPLGQTALFDEGPGGTPASGVTVVNQLKALGVTHLDHHFTSHYHSDHIGNFTSVLSGGIALDYGWDRAQSYTTTTYTNYVSALGARRRTMVKNQIITLDSLSAHPVYLKCVDLAGAGVATSDENSLSLVVKVSYGEFDEVIGGDLTGSTGGGGADIESIIGPEVGQVEVYKVHHHGSRYSSNTTWLNAIRPKVGVIECGNGNSYGHPTLEALTRLHAAGVRTYWTETGAGAAPDPAWDKVALGQITVSATWQPGGIDSVSGNGFADVFTNSGTNGDTTPPVVAIGSPVGGENWSIGSVHPITWSATDNIGVAEVDLSYSTDGGVTFPNVIANNVPNTGSYNWTPPAVPSAAARVRVLVRDAAGNLGADSSASSFTIYGWTVAAANTSNGVISPPGSAIYSDGATPAYTITPNGGYHVGDVFVNGSSVGAVTNYTFAALHANQTLNANFVANPPDSTPPVVAITAPVGGETWPVGSVQNITWNASDNIGVTAIDLTYSVDGGVTFSKTIATNLANTGSYAWTVPTTLTSSLRVRVRARDLSNNVGASASPSNVTISGFTLSASAGTGGTISPNGTTIVAPGVTQSYTMAANAGYAIGAVTVDGAAVGAVSTYSFTSIAANHTIAVSFAPTNSPSAYPMALGNYLEGFDDIANWADGFTAGIGASYWSPVGVIGTGAIPDPTHTTTSTTVFKTSFTGGVQKGTGSIILLSTGTTDNSTSDAIDVNLDFTGVTAGTVSFDWAEVANNTGNRAGSMRVYGSVNGTSFTELPGAAVLNVVNNVASSGHVGSVALPAAFTASPTARLRFYYSNGSGGTSGSRPKIAFDNLAITGTPIPVTWTITASAGSGGTISPLGGTTVNAGASQAYVITPNTGFHVLDVLVDGASVGAVTGYTFTNVSANHTIAASFSADQFTLNVGIVGSGSVTRSPDLATYTLGQQVQLTATAELGFAFLDWSGDTTAFANPLTITMAGNRNLIAKFIDVQSPLVHVTAPHGGESWPQGSVQNIMWTASDNVGVDSVTVQYSLGGLPGPWVTIVHGIASTGSQAWTVPAQSSDSALVRVRAYDRALNTAVAAGDSLFRIPANNVGVGSQGPAVLMLSRPQPNPSAGLATLRFSLPQDGQATIEILDVEGRRVASHAGRFTAGAHTWAWDGHLDGGSRPSGLYFARLTTPWGRRTERLLRVR